MMTEWIEEDRYSKKKTLEKLEGLEGELNNVLFAAYALGNEDGYNRSMEERHPDRGWLKEQLDQARAAGFKEGQEAALRSIEGSNKKIYEG